MSSYQVAPLAVLLALAAAAGSEVARPAAPEGLDFGQGRCRGAHTMPEGPEEQPKHVLPTNKQVSAFLPGGEYKRFLYSHCEEGSPVSLVVTPCSSELRGTITFYPDIVREGGKSRLLVRQMVGPGQVIYSERRGQVGSYDVNITALQDTYVHFLASDEDLAGLDSLQTKVKVKSRSRNRADISWAPASFGGQALHYCLITSPSLHFSTICGALSAKFGLQPPDVSGRRRRRQQAAPQSRRRRQWAVGARNITVGCVGKDTVYTLHDLVAGPSYRLTVFGLYTHSNVSFSYGETKFRYEDLSDSVTVRQGRLTRLRLTPARPVRRLRLKPPRRPSSTGALHYYVASCGGRLRLRVLRGRRRPAEVQSAQVVNGALVSGNDTAGWYQFELELAAAGGAGTVAEFRAAWRAGRLRLARLPDRPEVRQASRRRRRRLQLGCGDLALQIPRSKGRRLQYCVLLEPDNSGRIGRRFKSPSICGLDTRLERHPANLTLCDSSRNLRRGKRVEVIFRNLEPGQMYVVRAMVRSQGGRFRPYNLTQVMAPACSDQWSNELTESRESGPISKQLEHQGNREPAVVANEEAEEADNKLNDQ